MASGKTFKEILLEEEETAKDLDRASLQAERAALERVVQTYKEAGASVQQKQYREALDKYREVVREGAKVGDPMVLKLVSAALRLIAQCQFHLWQSLSQAKETTQVRKTDEFGEKWKGLLAEKREREGRDAGYRR